MNTVQLQIVKALKDADAITAEIQDQEGKPKTAATTTPGSVGSIYLNPTMWTYQRSGEVFRDETRQLDIRLIPQASRGSRVD